MSDASAETKNDPISDKIFIFNTLTRICKEFFNDKQNRPRFHISVPDLQHYADQWSYSIQYVYASPNAHGEDVSGQININILSVLNPQYSILEVFDLYNYEGNDEEQHVRFNFDIYNYEDDEDVSLLEIMFRVWLAIDRSQKNETEINNEYESIKEYIMEQDESVLQGMFRAYKTITDEDIFALGMGGNTRLAKSGRGTVQQDVLHNQDLLQMIRNAGHNDTLITKLRQRFGLRGI